MPRAMRVCPCLGCPAHERSCPELTTGGRCERCTTTADQRRGTRQQRGYDSRWERKRKAYLSKPEHLFCVLCHAPSNVADHYPVSRRDLVAQGVPDPDADHRLRPLCRTCHSKETAANPGQRGGWNAR